MLKKLFSILIAMVMLFSAVTLVGCGKTSEKPEEEEEEEYEEEEEVKKGWKYVSLFKDKNFQEGLGVRPLNIPIYGDPIEIYGMDSTSISMIFDYSQKGYSAVDMLNLPVWRLCQWSSRYPFTDVNNTHYVDGINEYNYKYTNQGNGVSVYDNTSKTVTINTKNGDFGLALRASKCYKYARTQGQEWPHLLLEQDNFCYAGKPTQETAVKNMRELKITIDMKLNSFVDHMGNSANPGLHGSICMFYLYLKYLKNGGFSDMIWLGMTLFDNRTPYPAGMSQIDDPDTSKPSATKKWIYNVEGYKYLNKDNVLYDGQGNKLLNTWVSIDYDILPEIQKAMKDAQAGGKMIGATMNDLYITGMYIGFENTGTYDIDMSFKNMDIQSKIYTRL